MKPHNTCPKSDRCKNSATCTEHDIFHSEYLCFEGRVYGNQAHPERRKENHGNKFKRIRNDKS